LFNSRRHTRFWGPCTPKMNESFRSMPITDRSKVLSCHSRQVVCALLHIHLKFDIQTNPDYRTAWHEGLAGEKWQRESQGPRWINEQTRRTRGQSKQTAEYFECVGKFPSLPRRLTFMQMPSRAISRQLWPHYSAIYNTSLSMTVNVSFTWVVSATFLCRVEHMLSWRAGRLRRMRLNSGQLLAQAACEVHPLSQLPYVLTSLFLNSGEVFQGTWSKTPIAIKVLKADGGVAPSSAVR